MKLDYSGPMVSARLYWHMLSIHLESGEVRVRKAPAPRRPEGHSLIRLRIGGICNTDLELQRGYYGFRGRPGHEFVGEVVESGNSKLIGKRVVGEINLACERCDWCSRHLQRHCPNRTVLGIVKHPGAFAEFLTLPDANLHVVPNGVADEAVVFVEPLAAAGEILDQVKIGRGQDVAVLGDGKLGLLIGLSLVAHGHNVAQFGRHKEKLAIVREAGVEANLSVRKAHRHAFDIVVDATGSSAGLAQAVEMAKPRGTVVMKSTVHDRVAIDAAPVIVNEITLVGSRCGRFEPALKLLRSGKVNPARLISGEFALSDGPAAFARAAEKGVLKVLLRNS